MRIFWLLALIVAFAACKGKDKAGDKAYQQTKQSLADKEKENPTGFLTITEYDKRNLFGLGRQTIVKGKVTNLASVCSYKDVRVKMLCFDKDGKRVEEHEDIVDDVIAPGATASYRAHYKLPKETDSIALSIMSATAIIDTAKK
ncbi:MAG TPA: hypothetical protein VG738_16950 [Chitinophagaceae bacterium]|nr:hypothetical protein [Chitinophagaceae bacterium]